MAAFWAKVKLVANGWLKYDTAAHSTAPHYLLLCGDVRGQEAVVVQMIVVGGVPGANRDACEARVATAQWPTISTVRRLSCKHALAQTIDVGPWLG